MLRSCRVTTLPCPAGRAFGAWDSATRRRCGKERRGAKVLDSSRAVWPAVGESAHSSPDRTKGGGRLQNWVAGPSHGFQLWGSGREAGKTLIVSNVAVTSRPNRQEAAHDSYQHLQATGRWDNIAAA